MNTIYKYPIRVTDNQIVDMPKSALILTAQVQNSTPCIWALVDKDASTEPRHFQTYGTGHNVPSPNSLVYVGTYQLQGGDLVFHVFEKLE